MRNYDEKRDFVRVTVDSTLSFGVPEELDEDVALGTKLDQKALLKNLSGRGLMFVTDNEVTKDSLIDIMVVPSNELTKPLYARVKVVRVMKQRHGDGYEVGAVIQSMLDD
ncbi:PilZ domain-containing protein [Beggiatoa alba]|nr:PilZ domain-containing protein [Beggiatoa alba]